VSKLATMAEAIARYVPDNSTVAMGLALESLIPFAAGHEMIRQQRRGLRLLGPISDMLFDQLIGAGCVEKIMAAWVGNVSEGLGHCYRRAVEKAVPHAITVEEYSNFTIGLALLASSLGAPYIPTRSLLGSDIVRQNPHLQPGLSPLDNSLILIVPAIQPDVAIIQVQRSDDEGNVHVWGNLGICEEAMLAARDVVIVAEEIVPHDTIVSDPNRILGPAFKVRAVVHEPWSAYPSCVQGYYNRDHQAYHEYHLRTRSIEGFQDWLDEWVMLVPTHSAYMTKLDASRQASLAVKEHRYAAPVDYGF
jgi:glutaconate CoA-transferase, subunit A